LEFVNWETKITELFNVVPEITGGEKMGNLMLKLNTVIK